MTFIAESYAVMTAAEIAAAEAAAATAAEVAAAEAAAAAAAEAAAAEAATQAAAQQSAQQGITAASGAAPPPVGAPATPPPPAGGIGTVATPPPPAGSTPAGLEQLGQQGFTNPEDAARFDQFVKAFSEGPVDTGTSPFYQTASTPTSDVSNPLVQNTAVPPPPAPSIDPNIISVPPGAESEIVAPEFESLTRKELADYTKSEVGSNPFLKAFQDVTEYMGNNKFQTAALATTGLGYMGAFKPPGTPMPEKRQYKGQYSLSPNFRATSPEPNVYQ